MNAPVETADRIEITVVGTSGRISLGRSDAGKTLRLMSLCPDHAREC